MSGQLDNHLVWSFSTITGWSRVPRPDSLDAYDAVTTYGLDSSGLSAELLEHPDGLERWAVSIGGPLTMHTVLIDDLPSLLALMGQVLPLINHGHQLEAMVAAHEKIREEHRQRYATGGTWG